MFGGIDPMAALGQKGKKENEVKVNDKTPSPKEVKATEDEDKPQPPPLDSPKLSPKAKPGKTSLYPMLAAFRIAFSRYLINDKNDDSFWNFKIIMCVCNN